MTATSGRARRSPGRVAWAALLTVLALGLAACSDGVGPAVGEGPGRSADVASLEWVGGGGQSLLAGRRSPQPFRVRASDAAGQPVAGAVVRFSVSGEGGGLLSQPRALTDSVGVAETFLLEARSGAAVLEAGAGGARGRLELWIERAPGRLAFAPGTGASGLPGGPHPDSVVRVRLLDTDGRPLAGREVWFAGPPDLSTYRDSTDADGWAGTVVRRTALAAGDGRVYAFVLGFPEVTESTPRPLEAAAHRIVLVSVDGLRGDALSRWSPPTLARLAAEGAWTPVARTVLPTLTTPAHLSMLSGVSPETHGVRSEALEFTAGMSALEPLFRTASRHGAIGRAFMARGGPLEAFEVALECRLAFGLDSLVLTEPASPEIARHAAAVMSGDSVRALFVHFPEPERAGQAEGFESAAYGAAVQRVDSALAHLVAALDEETLLVVASDHGGGGAYGPNQHGSGADADVLIPVLLHGPRVVAGTRLGSGVTLLDVAPTLLWALGIRPPDGYEGRVLLEAFR